MKKTIVIYGAENESAKETAMYFSGENVYALFPSGKPEALEGVTTAAIDPLSDEAMVLLARQLEEKHGGVDLLVLCASLHGENDGSIGSHDMGQLAQTLDRNVNGCWRMTETLLPLLRKGEWKRIGVITPEEGSIRQCRSTKDYGWLMSCASINMMQKLNFNRLHSEGFMFRNYMEGTKGITPGEYMAMNFCFDPNDAYIHSDENRLILRNGQLREYAW